MKKLKEFVTDDIIVLKNYLSMSDEDKAMELISIAPYILDEFIDIFEKYADENDLPELVQLANDYEWDSIWDNYIEDSPELKSMLTVGIMNKGFAFDIDENEQPTWYYLDYRDIIKNQWLIHFTDDAYGIVKDGFTGLVSDFTKLGLTTRIGKDSYHRDGDAGFGFCYLLSDFEKYGKNRHAWKYGSEAVVFRASGVRVWHHGDEEYQVIFKSDTVTDIVAIEKGADGEHYIQGKGRDNAIRIGELSALAHWIPDNYGQYRNALITNEKGRKIAETNTAIDEYNQLFKEVIVK